MGVYQYMNNMLDQNTGVKYFRTLPQNEIKDQNQQQSQEIKERKEEALASRKTGLTLTLTVSVMVVIGWIFCQVRPVSEVGKQQLKKSTVTAQMPQFPRVLWVYTDNEFDSLALADATIANHHIQQANRANFSVRLVNHTSAYDWLSEQTTLRITQARQKVRLDLEMGDLLMLALLIENGGVAMRHFDTLLSSDALDWISEAFEGTEGDTYESDWTCSPERASLLLLTEDLPFKNFPRYSDSFIAARPNSTILKMALYKYIQISTSEPYPQNFHGEVLKLDNITRSFSAPSLVQFCLSVVVSQQEAKIQNNHQLLKKPNKRDSANEEIYDLQQSLCQSLGLQNRKFSDQAIDARMLSGSKLSNFIISTGKNGCERKNKLLIQVDKKVLKEMFAKTLKREKDMFAKGSLMSEIVRAEGNRQILIEPLPERTIEFCIILLQELSEEEIASTVGALGEQDYKNWSVVFPVKEPQQLNNKNISSVDKIRLLKSTGSTGHNIEQAITRMCPHRAHALLLNKGERLASQDGLQQLSECLRPREVLGCLVSLEVGGVKLVPQLATKRFNRRDEGIVNPDLERMKNMSNHLRTFAVETYKFLPQFDMRDPYGNYYDDRIIFVMSFYDMVRDSLEGDDEKAYVVKKYAPKFNIPRKISICRNASIITDRIDEIDRDQLKRTFTRIDVESFQSILRQTFDQRISFEKMIAFNAGLPYQDFRTKEGPLINQPIIHQAWLGGPLPPVKQYIFDKTGKMFPQFQMRLWTTANITRQNFPVSYQYMKNLCEFNRNSPYNKFAVITDILRHEALYRHGGFWKDSTLSIMKPYLSHFRKYKLTLPVDKTLRYRYLQGMCFYGHVKHYEPVLRIVNFKNLNRMRIYQRYALAIAGPIDFRKLVYQNQQYDSQSLILPYESFYPGQVGQHPAGDMCVQVVSKSPQFYQTIEKGYGAFNNCSDIYPQAFGIEHNNFGSTWNYPQNLHHPRPCQIY